MDRNLLDTNVVAQIGVVVKDIEKTSQAIADFFGMDKPEIIMTPSREHRRRRGRSWHFFNWETFSWN